MKNYFPYINNKKIISSKTIKFTNSFINEEIGEIYQVDKNNIDYAFECANKSFKKWKNSKVSERINIVKQWISNILKNKDILSKITALEVNKSIDEVENEIKKAINSANEYVNAMFSFFSEGYNGENADLNFIASYANNPLGVVCLISPFNYPIHSAIIKIVPALLTGNTIIFKSSTQGSICASILSKCLVETSIPAGVFNYLVCEGRKLGNYIIQHKSIKLINFTGSTNVGKSIFNTAYFCKFILELGGKGTAIVLKDANIPLAAKNIIKGAFSYNGQRCTAIKRIIVEKSVQKKLTNELLKNVSKLTIGSPLDNKNITPIINKKSFDFILQLLDEAIANGATPICGNKTDNLKNIIYPTILTNIKENYAIFNEEQFGPVLPILTIDDNKHEEILTIVNKSNYGLQSIIYSTNINLALHFAKNIETGTVHINGLQQRGPEYLPFLGIKDSGLGVQSILTVLKTYTNLKGIIIH